MSEHPMLRGALAVRLSALLETLTLLRYRLLFAAILINQSCKPLTDTKMARRARGGAHYYMGVLQAGLRMGRMVGWAVELLKSRRCKLPASTNTQGWRDEQS